MFKNLLVYRIELETLPAYEAAAERLEKEAFVPCGPTQPSAHGWVPPRGQAHAPLLESVDGRWLLAMKVEQRAVPGPVVKKRIEELAARIEAETGRAPGRKLRKELKEQALLELMPQAFTRESTMRVWLDPRERWLAIDTSSATRAEVVVSTLVRAFDDLKVLPLQTKLSPATAMTQWLLEGQPPGDFAFGRECELKATDDTRAVVRYARHGLEHPELRTYLEEGKRPTRVALSWQDRLSFVLSDTLQVKKLAFEDVVFESARAGRSDTKDDDFDTDAALATGELAQMLPDLLEALGGEGLPEPAEAIAAGTQPLKQAA